MEDDIYRHLLKQYDDPNTPGEEKDRIWNELNARHHEIMTALSPEVLLKSQIGMAKSSFWRSWFLSRCADTIYRKLLYYLAADRYEKMAEAALWTATLIVPVKLAIPATTSDEEAIAYFMRSVLAGDEKLLVRPIYDEPHPSDWRFQGEIFSTRITSPVVVKQYRLLVFLCPEWETSASVQQQPLRALGLLLPPGVPLAEGVPEVRRVKPTNGRDVSERIEAELLASTLPSWVGHLFANLTEIVEASSSIFFLPSPPRPDLMLSHPNVGVQSILPEVFALIQRTISPEDPDLVACYLCAPSSDGGALYTIGSSANYRLIHVPDVRIVVAGGLNWDGMGLCGRAAIFGQQLVARYAGIDVPEELRDPRVLYAREEQVVEAVATPIQGGREKATGLGVSDESLWRNLLASTPPPNLPAMQPRHLYAVLYVYTKEPASRSRGLLKSEHILWLRELSAMLGEYFGWASASSMRDRQLSRDRETTYRSMIASVDSEREAPLKELLGFVHKRVKGMDEKQDPSEEERAPLEKASTYLPPGITFVNMSIAGHEGVAQQ